MKKTRRSVQPKTRTYKFEPYHQRFHSWFDLHDPPKIKKKKKHPRRLKKLPKSHRKKPKKDDDSGSDTSVDDSMIHKLSLCVSDEDLTAELNAVMPSPENRSPSN